MSENGFLRPINKLRVVIKILRQFSLKPNIIHFYGMLLDGWSDKKILIFLEIITKLFFFY